jgi:hypothetical protein
VCVRTDVCTNIHTLSRMFVCKLFFVCIYDHTIRYIHMHTENPLIRYIHMHTENPLHPNIHTSNYTQTYVHTRIYDHTIRYIHMHTKHFAMKKKKYIKKIKEDSMCAHGSHATCPPPPPPHSPPLPPAPVSQAHTQELWRSARLAHDPLNGFSLGFSLGFKR